MANEFVAKNGLISQNNTTVSGSLTVTQGSLVVTGSTTSTLGFTGSLLGTASTASYYQETDPVFVAKSASLATTGSNTFAGTQIVTGSDGRLIYTGTALGVYFALAEIHTNNDNLWLERFYNDTFSTTSASMAYFGWDDGRFVFHNESTQSIGLQVNGFEAENGLLVYSDKVAFINNIEVTGSLNVSGSITGSLFGTASYITGSIFTSMNPALSASFALTASYAANAGGTFNSTSSFVGDGVNTSYNINHGFNTRNLHITVYESSSNGETVYPDIRRINANTASIIFANPPSTDQYIVYISQ